MLRPWFGNTHPLLFLRPRSAESANPMALFIVQEGVDQMLFTSTFPMRQQRAAYSTLEPLLTIFGWLGRLIYPTTCIPRVGTKYLTRLYRQAKRQVASHCFWHPIIVWETGQSHHYCSLLSWCLRVGLNRRHRDFQSRALPTELHKHMKEEGLQKPRVLAASLSQDITLWSQSHMMRSQLTSGWSGRWVPTPLLQRKRIYSPPQLPICYSPIKRCSPKPFCADTHYLVSWLGGLLCFLIHQLEGSH